MIKFENYKNKINIIKNNNKSTFVNIILLNFQY